MQAWQQVQIYYKYERPRDRSNSSKGSRSSSTGAHSTPRGVGEARPVPLVGWTSRRCLVDISRKEIVGQATRSIFLLSSSANTGACWIPTSQVQKGQEGTQWQKYVSGVGEATEEIGVADVVETREGRGSSRSKSAENSTSVPCIHYACVVIKDDYWEVSESGNVVTGHHVNGRNAPFDPSGTKCPFPVRMLSDTRRTRYDQEDFDSSRVKDNWRTHNSDKSTVDWTGKSIFRFKNRHQVATSSHRKKLCSRYLLIGKSRQEHFKLKTIWLNISTSNSRRVNCINLPVIARNQGKPTHSKQFVVRSLSVRRCRLWTLCPSVVSNAIINHDRSF